MRQTAPVDEDGDAPRLSFPVVGIGASAGGLEAFFEFFDEMPVDSGMAFVLIQHLPPERESLLVELLAKRTQIPVSQIVSGQSVEANHVYVIRPGHYVRIHDGKLHLEEPLGPRGQGRPIDEFFKSLAEEQRERAICVVMSGMGSNGSAGAQAVKVVGGLVIAQDPDQAKFPSMPQSLIDQGAADSILRTEEMASALIKYASHPYARERHPYSGTAEREQYFVNEVLALLRARTKHDFSGYKRPTIARRIQRRMGVNHITRVDAYAQALRQNPSEASALVDDLLIHVTGFFRDAEAWEALQRTVIFPMVEERENRTEIRCWVTACSTGQEAYTLAILIAEAAEARNKTFDIKIFATDMALRALGPARLGVYPDGIETEITPERLARYFEKDASVYRVKPELRDLVVFAPQNVLQDPPFSRLDICTCRNLLIYLDPATQSRVLSLLHFGLREYGTLFLGSSETTAGADDMFEAVDKRWRIFRRVGPTRHGAVNFAHPTGFTTASIDNLALRHGPRASLPQLTTRLLLEKYAPASVTIDRDFRVVYFHGDTSDYLKQPAGEPTRELLKLAREEVRHVVRTALDEAVASGKSVAVRDGRPPDPDKRDKRTWVTATPLDSKLAQGYLVLTFEQRPEAAPFQAERNLESDDSHRLREELERARDQLERTVGELQVRNDELRASNEEVTSINEELQSTNEELETSKEELQSLNEELTTVNGQLHAKIQEHETTSNDLSSLLLSTDIAVVFLDRKFRIRRYTPAVRDLLDLIPADVGRPLANLAKKFTDPDLLKDADAVLELLVPMEREIRSESGRFYARRLLPYRTADSRIDGIVITFVDITSRKRSELALLEKARLLDLTNDAIVVRDASNRIIYWNRGAADHFGWSADEAIGRDMHALLRTQGEPSIDRLLSDPGSYGNVAGEVMQTSRDGRRLACLCRWSVDRDADGRPVSILTSMNDISESKRSAEALRERDEQFRLLAEGARDFAMLLLDPKGVITTWNVGAERLLGLSEAEAVAQSGAVFYSPEDRQSGAFERELARAVESGRAEDARWYVRKDGLRFFGSGVTNVLRGQDGSVRGFVKVVHDDTVRKLAEDTLQDAAERARMANRAKDEFLAMLSHELRTPLGAIHIWTNVLRDTKSSEKIRMKAVEGIAKSASAQQRLIDDLLDTSRIAAGTLQVRLHQADLGVLLKTWVDALAPTAESKGIRLVVNIAPDVGVVATDADRLQQVLWNLLSNAIKFTDAGGHVTVDARRADNQLHIRVADSGVGIAQEFLPYVFDPFRQADASTTRSSGGLGLGLAIVAKLVELLGGTIRATSDGLGLGTTVTVALPVAPPSAPLLDIKVEEAAIHAAPAAHLLRGVTMLVVEDTDESRDALVALMEDAGASVVVAETAATALDVYRARKPRVVISDLAMPREDGYTLMRRIRDAEAAEGHGSPVIAVAVSALARDTDRAASADAGFNAHVAKPFDPYVLVAVLGRLLGRTNGDGVSDIAVAGAGSKSNGVQAGTSDGVDGASSGTLDSA